MWPHKDLGWWGFVLSLVALFLLYPVGVIVNITTPKLQNWWAGRSVATMRKRIENLEKQLADYEQHEELSEGEDYILLASEALALLLELCVSMLAVVLLTLIWFAPPTVSSAEKRPIVLLALTAGVTGFLISVIVFGRFSTFRRKRSPIQRIALKRSIEKLKERLTQKNLASLIASSGRRVVHICSATDVEEVAHPDCFSVTA